MTGLLSIVYGLAAYVFFLATFLYAIAFVGDLPVPKTIDSGAASPLAEALIVNLLLLGLFAVQHSVMARPAFKRWWTRIVPERIERSTYVLAATAALALLLWQWRPIAEPVFWHIENRTGVAVLSVVFWAGWAVLLVSTFLLNHFELFGLRQVFAPMRSQSAPTPEFRTPAFYRYVRHPIYLGFLLAFWATPVMTAGHLLFAAGSTGYILIGIWFEERDLVAQFGDRYRQYRRQVGMLVPWRNGDRPASEELPEAAARKPRVVHREY
jgi:methanethiol S-methyltransferase